MARWKTIARGASVVAVGALALAACSSSSDPEPSGSATGSMDSSDSPAASGDGLLIGSLLPITGSLAYLGPPEIAGVDLAIQEINEAGGVMGQDVRVEHTDSSDADNPTIASTSVDKLLGDGAAAIVGAASSTVSLNVVDTIAKASTVMISPANTSTALSGYSPFYFRVAPPDTVQGNVLGNLIVNDGHTKIGVLVFNEDYGTSLRDVIKETVEPQGAELVYGNPGDEFDPKASNFSSDVQAVLAADPDSIVVIAFDQTKQIIPELVGAGWTDMSAVYMTDGNTADYSGDFDPGVLEGAQGTIPGAFPDDAFKERLNSVAPEPLDSFAYGPESYDATILVALAAEKGQGTDGTTVQENLAAVTGATGGDECSTYADCLALLQDGQEINYKTVAGSGPLNDQNDPSSAFIGIYKYLNDNTIEWQSAQEGEA
ncbi:ABC transporter substrate-binding protein [Demequina aurantiaca]|uniref:ABC transporter substrate-binding protein n=1 Tax=Demequina aurantiaca TaxID=676200 RepID=UPI000780C2F4|nr:ABC transporter substrate-binding protein [Demequina aurantiaca]